MGQQHRSYWLPHARRLGDLQVLPQSPGDDEKEAPATKAQRCNCEALLLQMRCACLRITGSREASGSGSLLSPAPSNGTAELGRI